MTLQDLSGFDPISDDLARTFHDTFEQIRGTCPVAHSTKHGGLWVLSKYEDVWSAARNWETFTNTEGTSSVPYEEIAFPFLPEESDRPLQRDVRKIIDPVFSPKAIAQHEPHIRQVVRDLIAPLIARGSGDFMEEFANLYPSSVFFSAFLGMDPAPAHQLKEWIEVALGDPLNSKTALRLFGEWLNTLIEERRTQKRRDDLIDALIHAEILDRPMSDEERLGCLANLVIGGLDTVASAVGSMLYYLATDDSLQAQIQDRSVIPHAVEEFLRFDSPAWVTARVATRDVEVGGKQIKKGERVLLYLGSANRDEDEFTDADKIRFDRHIEGNRHIVFGAGPHRCPGSHLARLELNIALEEALPLMGHFHVTPGETVEFRKGITRGPKHLPLTLDIDTAAKVFTDS